MGEVDKGNFIQMESRQALTPMDMLSKALDSGVGMEQLERLMDLQERWEANEAKKAFNEALSMFKQNPPPITKNKHVSFKTTSYHHATLNHIVEQVSPALSAVGLSFNWKTTQEPGRIGVTCVLRHRQGHSEEFSLWGPEDNSGGKNDIQAVGSTVSYLERYTLLAQLGLATADQDDDGVGSVPKDKISEDQAQTIHTLFEEDGDERWSAATLEWLEEKGFESVEDITTDAYESILKAVQAAFDTRQKARAKS